MPAARALEMPAEAPKLSCLSYCGYYLLLFFAYWFGAHRFDADGDGDFDPEDVQFFLQNRGNVERNFKKTRKPQQQQQQQQQQQRQNDVDSGGGLRGILESEVQGQSVEAYVWEQQRVPVFLLLQSTLALLLWASASMYKAAGGDGSFWRNRAGLDSFSRGWSDLRLASERCEDYRWQVWRFLSYQWTHVGISHVLINCCANLVLGWSLEALHGAPRTLLMYNVGVFGGACCYWVGDAHRHVVGMSGGCYALAGMNAADLLMNWHQKKFRWLTLLALLLLMLVDATAYSLAVGESSSHTAHVGGAVAGLLIAVVIGRNLQVKGYERVLSGVAVVLGVALLVFCLGWLLAHEAPQSLYDAYGYCWTRQVYNKRLDKERWVCIRCGTDACIEHFSAEEHNLPVRPSECEVVLNGEDLVW